jgi:hypothetical protein
MDFVSWCESILTQIQQAARPNSYDSTTGFPSEHIVAVALPPTVTHRPDLWNSDERLAVLWALQDLQIVGLIEQPNDDYYRLTRIGRQHLQDALPIWLSICSIQLDDDESKALQAINRLSITQTDEGFFVPVQALREDLLNELGWADTEPLRLDTAINGLKRLGFVREIAPDIDAWSTYAGAVWELRRGETIEAQFLDALLADGETTSVDFKRELHLDTKDDKAEFVRDVLGLANTKASGRRWLIIGFNDKLLTYHGSPDSKITQNRLEHILSDYTAPQVQVRNEVVIYRGNQVGKLEVLRNRADLPYKVATSIGDKKRIEEGTIYVRHGSQTEQPTEAERAALQDEGDRARMRENED